MTEEVGFDEVFLVFQGKKIWPEDHLYKSVKKGHTEVNVEIRDLNPNTQLEIEIWDFDYLSANDLLGKFSMFIDEPGGPYTTDLMQNVTETGKAKYSITWEIDFEG